MKTSAAARRSAFTLVELLVVVGILAVLAALLSAAVANALRAAKETAIKVDIDQLDLALKAYKSEFGTYPPNWNNTALVRRHLMKRFPRITTAERDAIEHAGNVLVLAAAEDAHHAVVWHVRADAAHESRDRSGIVRAIDQNARAIPHQFHAAGKFGLRQSIVHLRFRKVEAVLL